MNEAEVIKQLMGQDEEFKSMYDEHRELDGQVRDLETKDSHANTEIEIKQLKKQKLALKDQMEQKKKQFLKNI